MNFSYLAVLLAVLVAIMMRAENADAHGSSPHQVHHRQPPPYYSPYSWRGQQRYLERARQIEFGRSRTWRYEQQPRTQTQPQRRETPQRNGGQTRFHHFG